MAVRVLTQTKTGFGYTKLSWATALLNGDTGDVAIVGEYPWMSVCVQGTLGSGGSCQMEASYDGGTTWAVVGGPVTSFGGQSAVVVVLQGPFDKIRPHVTAGDGTTSLTFYVIAMGVRG